MIIEKLKISELKIDPDNAKLHPKYQVQQLVDSIKQFGFCDPIGIWKDNTVVEGHGRLIALKQLGYDEVDCIRLDHLSDDERKAYALAHNSINLSSGFDAEILNKVLSELAGKIDMDLFGLSLNTDETTTVVEDEYEATEITVRVKKGELWELGKHLLYCGDCTKAEGYDRLLRENEASLCVTDPPYNVDYKGGTKDELRMQNDHMTNETFGVFLTTAFTLIAKHLKAGGGFYVWHASSSQKEFDNALRAAKLLPKQQLIWVKNTFVLGRQDYQWQHEPCIYGWKEGAAHYFRNDRTQTTVQESDAPVNLETLKKGELYKLCKELMSALNCCESTIIREDKPNANEEHPTMKPIKLIARLISNSSRSGEIVLDPFGGSGSTLIACEQLRRSCRIIELDERYASVIIDRWERYTGLKAARKYE